MSKKKNVIIIGELNFPQNSASSIRVYGLAASTAFLKMNPIIIGRGNTKKNSDFNLDFLEVDSFNNCKESSSLKKQYIAMLNKYNSKNLQCVILYGSSSARFYSTVSTWCKKNNTKLILDICENYSYKQFRHGFFDKNYILFKYNFFRKYRTGSHFITCSDFSASFFKEKEVVKINAIMDIKVEKNIDILNELSIVYAGNAGKKDYIHVIIKAINKYNSNFNRKIHLKIIGPEKKEIERIINRVRTTNIQKKYISCLGVMSRDEVLDHLKVAHFTILVRPNEVYANFGFPSKIAESLCVSTPIIANVTSDLNIFLEDNKCGISLNGDTFQDVYSGLAMLNSLSNNEYLKMVKNTQKYSLQFIPREIAKRTDFRRLLNE